MRLRVPGRGAADGPVAAAAWDLRLALRAAALAGLLAAITLLVVAATDEGGPLAMRLGMTAALAPAAGSLGSLAALRIAAARGELRALAAIGASPDRAAIGAVLGGALVGLAGAIAAASPLVDLGPLFPRPAEARVWVPDGDGLREASLGVRVGAGGVLSLAERSSSPGGVVPASAAPFAVALVALAAIAGPVWIASLVTTARPVRRAAVGGAALAAAIGAFQGVAAGRLSPAALLGAPLILLIDGALSRYRSRG